MKLGIYSHLPPSPKAEAWDLVMEDGVGERVLIIYALCYVKESEPCESKNRFSKICKFLTLNQN